MSEFRILERLKQAALDIRRNSSGGDDVDWKLNQSVCRVLNSFIENEERSSPTGLTEWTSNPSIHVAWWMMRHGYATGHGDTLDDLLSEMAAQIVEKTKSPLFLYDQDTGHFTLIDDVPGTSQAGENFSETGKEIPKPATERARVENNTSTKVHRMTKQNEIPGVAQGAREPANLPHGWEYQAQTNSVVCGGCAFRYGADHSDADGNWTCPNCGDGNGSDADLPTDQEVRGILAAQPPAAPLPMLADIEQIIKTGWRAGKSAADIAEEVLREFDGLQPPAAPVETDVHPVLKHGDELHELGFNAGWNGAVEECAKIADLSGDQAATEKGRDMATGIAAAIRARIEPHPHSSAETSGQEG